MPKYPDDTFYETDSGMVMCGRCLNKWIRETNEGRFKDDPENGFKVSAVIGKTEVPSQCDDCLEQEEGYDEFCAEDDEPDSGS